MKKILKVLSLLLCLSLLQGCSYEKPEYIHFEKKPSLNFYTNEINNKILKGKNYSIEIFDTNISKTTKIDDSEKVIIEDLINSLNNDSYKKVKKIKELEPYQIKVKFNDKNDKYVINVYNNEYITISPWDGIFEMDYISMENVPERYNLYNFCEYIKNRSDLGQ